MHIMGNGAVLALIKFHRLRKRIKFLSRRLNRQPFALSLATFPYGGMAMWTVKLGVVDPRNGGRRVSLRVGERRSSGAGRHPPSAGEGPYAPGRDVLCKTRRGEGYPLPEQGIVVPPHTTDLMWGAPQGAASRSLVE